MDTINIDCDANPFFCANIYFRFFFLFCFFFLANNLYSKLKEKLSQLNLIKKVSVSSSRQKRRSGMKIDI